MTIISNAARRVGALVAPKTTFGLGSPLRLALGACLMLTLMSSGCTRRATQDEMEQALQEEGDKQISEEVQNAMRGLDRFGNPMVPKPAAEDTAAYLKLLRGKRVGLVVNQTSRAHGKHLIELLREAKIDVVKIYALEHGYRGTAAEGEKVKDAQDEATGIEVVSLYGANYKPSAAQLAGTDVVLFDIQDVGARFYTFLSSMHYVMEACAEQGRPLVVLDRPNPNGQYVDGPVLDTAYRSFVGMHPIPVVHGCTMGEMAKMIVGEKWIKKPDALKLTVVKCLDYKHSLAYELPVAPSPNLPNAQAVWLYPSLCFFEGTIVSVGRGTEAPFQVFGFPGSALTDTTFTPMGVRGAKVRPMYDGQACQGASLRTLAREEYNSNAIQWEHLLSMYANNPEKQSTFFKKEFFDKLAGGPQLRQLVENGSSPAQIRAAYRPAIGKYLATRQKYLLYPAE